MKYNAVQIKNISRVSLLPCSKGWEKGGPGNYCRIPIGQQVTSKGLKRNLNSKMYNKTTNRMLLRYTSVKEVICFLLKVK